MANTWNQSGTTWNTGRWGTTDPIVTGWGAKSWNEPGTTWNDIADQQVNLTSPGAITSSLGSTEISTESNKNLGREKNNYNRVLFRVLCHVYICISN